MIVRTSCPCCGVTLDLNVPGKITWRECPNCFWYWSVSTDDHQPDLPMVVGLSREVAHQGTRDALAAVGFGFTEARITGRENHDG